jgi:hypothetical protein
MHEGAGDLSFSAITNCLLLADVKNVKPFLTAGLQPSAVDMDQD